MENKMSEVAKLLGVELGEKFDILGKSFSPFTLTSEGFFDKSGDCESYEAVALLDLLLGKLEIIRPLLTKDEKEFLEYILRQYKEYGIDVRKVSDGENEFLLITIKRGVLSDSLILPNIIEDDLQFKGLENGNRYTKEELNLYEGE